MVPLLRSTREGWGDYWGKNVAEGRMQSNNPLALMSSMVQEK